MRQHRTGRSAVRLAAIPLIAALIAASCGGGGSGGEKSSTKGGDNTETSAKSDTADTKSSAESESSGTKGVDVTIAPVTDKEPVDGGTLRYAVEAEVDGLNPTASAMTAASGLEMASAVFDTLAEYGVDGKYVPYLAESFTPNADFSEWDVKVREGIKFHDGTPLDGNAVLFNFQSQFDNPLIGIAVKPFVAAEGAFTLVDPMTVHVKLAFPNAQWPTVMATQQGMMASPAWIEAAKTDPTLNQKPVGTGPFKFDSRKENAETRFVRNDEWWNGHVYLDAIEFVPVTDFTDRNDLLLKGEVQAEHNTDPSAIVDLRDNSDTVQLVEDDNSSETFVMMNTSIPPFNDIRARQALAWATPRQDYESLIGLDVTRMADQRFAPDSPFYNPDVKQAGDDVAKAAELVKEYCAEKGTETNALTSQPTCTDGKINFEYQWSGPSTANTRTADMFTQSWSEAGFNVKPDELLQSEHIKQAYTGQFNAILWRQFSAINPTNDNTWVMCRTVGEGISLNFPKNCNENLDKALLAAAATDDDATRDAQFQEAEKQINEQYTYIFLVHTIWGFGFASNVHGVCDRTSPEGVPLRCSADGRTWHSSVWIEQ